jgi:hypothetical protein
MRQRRQADRVEHLFGKAQLAARRAVGLAVHEDAGAGEVRARADAAS